jgi:hypothetical protein
MSPCSEITTPEPVESGCGLSASAVWLSGAAFLSSGALAGGGSFFSGFLPVFLASSASCFSISALCSGER